MSKGKGGAFSSLGTSRYSVKSAQPIPEKVVPHTWSTRLSFKPSVGKKDSHS